MNVLFIGDSITNGQLGASYVKPIAKANPKYTITNLGTDGDTMNIIIEKLLKHLQKNNNYDCIVLQGGYNDIILPTFKDTKTLFRFAYTHQINKGLVPLTNPTDFYNALKKAIQQIKQIHKGNIIVLTMGCINEDLNASTNTLRKEFNAVIRTIANQEKLILADAEIDFETILNSNRQTNYCMDNFWSLILFDKIKSYFKSSTLSLSHQRNLILTIDGVHLNANGAKIFSECILNKLKNIITI